MSIFGVSQGDAATFQEKYQQLIATLFSALLKNIDKKEDVRVQILSEEEEEAINIQISEEEEKNQTINIRISEEVAEELDNSVAKEIAPSESDLATDRTTLEPDLKAHPTNKANKPSAGFLPSSTAKSASKSEAIYSQSNLEARYMERVNAVAIALSQYAKNAGRKIQVDGMPAYRWLATPDGCVKIEAKNRPEPILVKTKKRLHVEMNSSELEDFEKALGISNPSQLQRNKRALQQPLKTPSQSIVPKSVLRKK